MSNVLWSQCAYPLSIEAPLLLTNFEVQLAEVHSNGLAAHVVGVDATLVLEGEAQVGHAICLCGDWLH